MFKVARRRGMQFRGCSVPKLRFSPLSFHFEVRILCASERAIYFVRLLSLIETELNTIFQILLGYQQSISHINPFISIFYYPEQRGFLFASPVRFRLFMSCWIFWRLSVLFCNVPVITKTNILKLKLNVFSKIVYIIFALSSSWT